MNESARGFYSSEQVRELERLAMAGGVSDYALMQRAAAACWRELTRRWPRAQAVSVVCGPGNNGGDGFEIARLAHSAGWTVKLREVGAAAGGKGAAAQARKAWLKAGGKVLKVEVPDARRSLPSKSLVGGGRDGEKIVIVDAIFGTGLSRAPEGAARAAIAAINQARARGTGVLAVDVPSGLDADRGSALGEAVQADLTVSFIGRKPGLYTGTGPDHAGVVVFDELDVPARVYKKVPAMVQSLEPELLSQLLPRRRRTAHKGLHGHVLLVGGDQGMGGAILLAARAALRAGAGLVSVGTHPAHAAALMAAQPELMVHGIENGRALRALFDRATVLALGPGLGRGGWGRELWSQALSAPIPAVVDADGLNWLAENPEHSDRWVLTPHPGEAARLLGIETAAVQRDRLAAVRALQQKFGGVAVLKGAGTVVQGAALALCPQANPGLAVGGSGDVLCGLIAGLLAQKLTLEAAAQAGVLAHAQAGALAAQKGERGLLPSDLLSWLRQVLNPLSPRIEEEG